MVKYVLYAYWLQIKQMLKSVSVFLKVMFYIAVAGIVFNVILERLLGGHHHAHGHGHGGHSHEGWPW